MLAIYLNDHLAGSVIASELAKRSASSNRGSPYGAFLEDLSREIDEDRAALVEIMSALGVGVDRLKVAAAWAAEKVGRLKLNGRLLGYSPLSRVVELEGLQLGVRGKLSLWRALDTVQPQQLAPGRLSELITRAERQLEGIETYRLQAVTEALAS